MKTTITPTQARELSKPLLPKLLKKGDHWYAVSSGWYHKFKSFAFLNKDNDKIEEKDIEYPPKMDNSCLSYAKNGIQLDPDLKEGEDKDFVWIHQELYQYFLSWFGIKYGSPTFQHRVISRFSHYECLMIERDPILICCALCDCNGKPNFMSKHVTTMSKKSNLYELSKKITSKMISSVREKASLITTYWYRTLMDDKYATISIDDIINIIIIYDTSSILAQNDDNINEKNLRIWRKTEVDKKEEDLNDEWVFQNVPICKRPIDELGLDTNDIDLWSDINFMIEICYDDGKWKIEYDENKWRKELIVGSRLDVYDILYSKWYESEVIELRHDSEPKQIKIHNIGYSSNYDEYIHLDSERLAELNTHTTPDPFWSTFITNW